MARPTNELKAFGEVISEDILDAVETPVDDKLRLVKQRHSIGAVLRHLVRGPWPAIREAIATETPHVLFLYLAWFMKIRGVLRNAPANVKVAYLGAGTCVFPRLLHSRSWGQVDIYEVSPEIIATLLTELPEAVDWNFIEGDYKLTYPNGQSYGLVFSDLPNAADGSDQFDQTLVESGMLSTGRWYRLDKLLNEPDNSGVKA